MGCTPPDMATFDGVYPYVFNNDLVDGSFGVTSPLFLDQLISGRRIGIRFPCRRINW